jgi:hypothetical protein
MCRARLREGYVLSHAMLYALFTLIGKFAEALGVLRFGRTLLRRRKRPAEGAETVRRQATAHVAPGGGGEA